MKAKFAGFGKLVLIPIFAIALASGSAAIVAAHGHGATHQGPKGATNDPTPDVSASASPSASPSPSASESPNTPDNSTVRFHGDATSCPMPDGTTLTGNWNHGNYVSAWAATGDHAQTLAAAHSDCGKPMDAVNNASSPEPSPSVSPSDKPDNESEQGDANENDQGPGDHGTQGQDQHGNSGSQSNDGPSHG